jgi:DNA polymerase IV
MSNAELVAKQAHFEEQRLLDLSDDEKSDNNEAFGEIESAMAEGERAKLVRQNSSSFLGPTPKETKAEFEAHAARRRAVNRDENHSLVRSTTAPEAEVTQSFPVTKPRARQTSHVNNNASGKIKRISSLPDMTGLDQAPFYQRMGVVPRELKNGKNVKLADNIKLEPESRQLLRGKVVYFYPNDDVDMARRTRIHMIIRLGAAWVNKWRDDITHVFVDDANRTYPQLLRHLNKAGLPVCLMVQIDVSC